MNKDIGRSEAKNIATYQGKHVDGYSFKCHEVGRKYGNKNSTYLLSFLFKN
jgi:hypothetical protein